jgi:HSP20 family molecular chaperone IbpA
MSDQVNINTSKEEVTENTVERTRDRRVFSPRTDIIETSDQYLVVADVPGADENSVNITLEKNVLSFEAHTSTAAPEGHSLVLSEYGLGDFARSFVLSDQIDRDNIEASVKNGVLRLVLPKAGPAKAQSIKVTAG